VEDEEYEETVKEKRELPAEEAPADAPAEGEAQPEGKEGEEKKKEPKYEWVDVKKMKKRQKRTELKITPVGTPGLPEDQVQKLMDAESAMQADMRDIIETDEKRNDLESYIFNTRDKICEGNEYGAYITSSDRDKFSSELMKAEDWLYDNEGSTKAVYMDKLDELKRTGDPVVWRFKEDSMRPEWIKAVTGTIENYRNAAQNPGDSYGHIAPEKLQTIVTACNELESWLKDMQTKQSGMPKHEKPALICADMEKKNQELAKQADDILKEPKPAPPKEEKKEEAPKEAPQEEKKEEAPAADANDVD
jgi:heat shock protein 4